MMKNRLVIPLLAGSALSAAALWLAFCNVAFNELWRYLGTIDYGWILPAAALILLAFFLRALRWQIILHQSGAISYWQAFHPLMIGFMINCILPARVGEFARPLLIKKLSGIPMATGVSTVVAKRLFDLLILLLLFAILCENISYPAAMSRSYFGFNLNGELLISLVWGMVKLSVALLIFIALLAIKITRELIKRCLQKIAAGTQKLGPRIETIAGTICNFSINIIHNFYLGLTLVKRPLRLCAAIGLTIMIWTVSALSYWVWALGCPGINLTIVELTSVLVVVYFFIALPSVPVFWGLWEAAGVFGRTLFGIAQREALGFTLINHVVQIFPVICAGLISALLTSVDFWRISRSGQPADLRRASFKGALI